MRVNNSNVSGLLAAFVVMAAAAYCSNARAETAVILGGWSQHLVTDEDYNETHKAALVEHGRLLAGRFTNSYGRETWAAGYGWSRQWGDLRGSVHAGLMRGYSTCWGEDGGNSNICPMIYPAVAYTRFRVQPQVGLLGEAVVLTVRVRLY